MAVPQESGLHWTVCPLLLLYRVDRKGTVTVHSGHSTVQRTVARGQCKVQWEVQSRRVDSEAIGVTGEANGQGLP